MEPDPRRREIFEKAKRFEERVAELFALHGYRTILDYKRNDQQFDIRLQKGGVPPIHALVECKDLNKPVGQEDLLKFAHKVAHAKKADSLPYQAIVVSRSGFVNNAHTVAEVEFIHLMTFEELVLSLVDLHPNLDAAVRAFQGTALEALYVEQETILEADIRPGEVLEPKGLTETVLQWLERPSSTSLTLLGDFGCGKTSFCKRIAAELAGRSRDNPGQVRMPILIDLREGGSTTVTLENLLTHHFQRLSSQPINPQALLHLIGRDISS